MIFTKKRATPAGSFSSIAALRNAKHGKTTSPFCAISHGTKKRNHSRH